MPVPLQPGVRIGPYEIRAAIGHGGMGEVYRARDTKLDREVAVKVLPDAFLSDPDRLERFEREARLLASLNHVNIAHVYGIEDGVPVDDAPGAVSGSRTAIIMELVEGETLAGHLRSGALPLDETLSIARQVADALVAAHEAGVVHRDLKPANIKVRDDGTVKVLDFGLAKAFAAEGEGSTPDDSPTLTARGTQRGVILGTAAYMAPEQAKGKHVDKRADVWAFAVVLYEMLTGKRLFTGDDVTDTLAAVLRAEPGLSELPSDTPPALRRLLRRALQRRRQDRLRDMADARLEIVDAEAGITDGDAARPAGPAASQPAFWQRPMFLAAGAVALAALTALATRTFSPAPVAPSVARLILTLSEVPVESTLGLEFSPDGRTLAFVVPDAGIFLRHRELEEPVLLAGTENAVMPFFSPAGEWIGYFAAGEGLRKVPVEGGPSAPVVSTGGRRGASWGSDGDIVLASTEFDGLMLVSESGGQARPLTEPEPGMQHRWPSFLPGGGAVVFSMGTSFGDSRLAAVTVDDGVVQDLGVAGSDPAYLPSGHLIFGRSESLWVVPFDAQRREILGEPRPVVEDARVLSSGYANFAAAGDGSIAYTTGEGPLSVLLLLHPDGTETVLSDEPMDFGEMRFSPTDDELVAIEHDNDISILRIGTRSMNRLTTIGGTRPEWSADGSSIIFDGPDGIYRQPWDQSADAELLLPTSGANPFLAANGTLFFTDLSTDWDISTWRPGEDPVSWLDTPGMDFGARVSPDGGWVAYISDFEGRSRVYVVAVDGSGSRYPVSPLGASGPMWSPDGRSLYYYDDALWRVPFAPDALNPIGTPVPVPLASTHQLRFRDAAGSAYLYDVARDGSVIVLGRTENDDRGRVRIVYHFAEELRARGR